MDFVRFVHSRKQQQPSPVTVTFPSPRSCFFMGASAYIWKEKKIHTFCPPFPSSIKRKWFIPISNILSLLFRKRFQNYPSLFLPLPGPLFCFPSSKPRESMVPWLLSFMHFHNTLGIMQWSVKLMRWYLTDFISHSLNIMVFKLTHSTIPSLFDRRNVTAIFRKFFLALLG